MAARAERRYEDISGDNRPEGSAREVKYVVFEATTFDEAVSVLDRDSELKEGKLVRSGFNGIQRLNDDTWQAAVSYVPFVGGLPDPSEFPGRQASFNFETGGGRRKVLKNIQTRQVVVATGATDLTSTEIAELGQLINGTEDGVEGVEIESSIFRFSASKAFSPAELPPSYVALLYDYTNKINLYPVYFNAGGIQLSFAAGELLFLGAPGGISNDDGLWKITFNFAAQKNQSGLVIEGLKAFTNPVLGWSYLEVKTDGRTVGTDPMIPVRVAFAAIEHVVYESRDLNRLGI